MIEFIEILEWDCHFHVYWMTFMNCKCLTFPFTASFCLFLNLSALHPFMQIICGYHRACKVICVFISECVCVCLQAARLPVGGGGVDKKWNQQFLFQQQVLGASPREGSIVQTFPHNAAIWRTEGSATGSLPEQRQTAIHICIEVVI